MQEGPDVPGVIIPFPALVVHLRVEPRPVVEHDGSLYLLAARLERLPDHVLADVDALVPWTAQATWDLVARRWPRWAKAAVGTA